MSRQIYKSFAFEDGDDAELKHSKLYLAAISIGEDLYSIGADLAEIRKKLDAMEKTVSSYRAMVKELAGASRPTEGEGKS